MVFILQEAEASVLLFVIGLMVQYDIAEALCKYIEIRFCEIMTLTLGALDQNWKDTFLIHQKCTVMRHSDQTQGKSSASLHYIQSE